MRISGAYGNLHEVKKHIEKGRGDFGRVKMCECGPGGFLNFVGEVKYLTGFSNLFSCSLTP